jgi:hypothetical protein
LCLATWLDLATREVIGYSMAALADGSVAVRARLILYGCT